MVSVLDNDAVWQWFCFFDNRSMLDNGHSVDWVGAGETLVCQFLCRSHDVVDVGAHARVPQSVSILSLQRHWRPVFSSGRLQHWMRVDVLSGLFPHRPGGVGGVHHWASGHDFVLFVEKQNQVTSKLSRMRVVRVQLSVVIGTGLFVYIKVTTLHEHVFFVCVEFHECSQQCSQFFFRWFFLQNVARLYSTKVHQNIGWLIDPYHRGAEFWTIHDVILKSILTGALIYIPGTRPCFQMLFFV